MIINKIIIDLEFNNLNDLEINQIKLKNMTNGKTICQNFKTKRKQCASSIVCCGGHIIGKNYFNEREFIKMLKTIGGSINDAFYGFSIKSDKESLSQYNIILNNYVDIQESIMLSKYEKALCLEGRSLEAVYYILNKQLPNITNHNGEEELTVIENIYVKNLKLRHKKFLKYYPWGRFAGTPLKDFVVDYRRQADGYRFNNEDLLSASLDYYIEEDDYFDDYFND